MKLREFLELCFICLDKESDVKLHLVTALTFFIATAAFAQTASPPSNTADQTPQPVAPNVKAPVTEAMKAAAPAAATPAQPASPTHFRNIQGQDQWLVGNLWNKHVYNAAGQSIGDMKDVLIDRDGKVVAVVIGVGGFLGLGEKNVAVDYDFLKANGGITGDRIVLGMNEQDLRSAPDFQRLKPSPVTTPANSEKTQ